MTTHTVTLRNKKTAIIRKAELTDTNNLYSCIWHLLQDNNYMVLSINDYTFENCISWVDSFKNPNSLLLVALDSNKIIGFVSIEPYKVEKMKHMAVISMAIEKTWRESGLGRHLSNTAIQWTKDNPDLEKLWVEIFADNEISLHGARTTGFKEIVTYKDYYKTQNGYVDNIVFCLNTTPDEQTDLE